MPAQADLKSVVLDLQKLFRRPLSKKELRLIGELTIGAIFDRTRKKGQGVARTGGNRFPLKRLSEQYIEFRKSFSKLSSQTSPSKSNLTLTGQMLEGLHIAKIQRGSRGTATVEVEVDPDDVDKALGNAARGRIFMNLSKVELRVIKEFMENAIKASAAKR